MRKQLEYYDELAHYEGFYELDRCEYRPLRAKWLVPLLDALVAFSVLILAAELAYAFDHVFFGNRAFLTTDFLAHFSHLEFDLFSLGLWVVVLALHFRYNEYAVFEVLLLFLLPIVYVPIYYFRSLRPKLRSKLRVGRAALDAQPSLV